MKSGQARAHQLSLPLDNQIGVDYTVSVDSVVTSLVSTWGRESFFSRCRVTIYRYEKRKKNRHRLYNPYINPKAIPIIKTKPNSKHYPRH